MAALDPRLAWETGPGLKGARRQLVLSAEGDPELRVLVERWRARAPPADAEWEYHPARQPSPRDAWPGMVLQADGVEIGFGDVRVAFETDDLRELVHVTCHHPAFATLEDVAARRAAFLVLGNVLGEDGVERWIGAIDASAAPLPDGEPLEALADAVSALAGRATGERYAVLEWRTDSDLPMLASANVAVKRIDHLLKDRHVEVVIPVRDPNASGLPTPEENAALNALEDELLAAVEDATTVWLGRETGEGLRITHLHATGDGGAEARARAWAAGHPDRRISVRTRPDPGWDVLDRWR